MSNELYTFAEPVQVVPFSNLKWGKFTLLHTISQGMLAKSTITWPLSLESSLYVGTIAYAISHPTTYIYGTKNNYDWYYDDLYKTDNTRWLTSEYHKTIYDPCPAGWRIPDGGENGVWAKASGTSDNINIYSLYDEINEGINLSGKLGADTIIWYATPGNFYRGTLYDIGSCGNYWTVSPCGYKAYNFQVDSYAVSFSDYDTRASCFSVRCIKER